MNLNQRYPEQIGTQSPKQSTYIDQLIEQMEMQLKRLSDVDGRLYGIANRLRQNEPVPQEIQKKSEGESAPGYLNTLFHKIDTLRNYNDSLEATTLKLEQIF